MFARGSLLCLTLLFATLLSASGASDLSELKPSSPTDPKVLETIAMPDLASSKLGDILENYYNRHLGGAERWSTLESVRMRGTIDNQGRMLSVTSYQKKPDLCKLKIWNDEYSVMLGYDGDDAWIKEGRSAVRDMSHAERKRFVLNSRFESLLLYPFKSDRRIEYIDAVPFKGRLCHQIRVYLEKRYEVDHFVDVRDYSLVKIDSRDTLNDHSHESVFTSYRTFDEYPVAMEVTNYENGEKVSIFYVDEVKVNSGVVPWLFARPLEVE